MSNLIRFKESSSSPSLFIRWINRFLCLLQQNYEAKCASETRLDAQIRGSQCYTHPGNLQFTISEIEKLEFFLKSSHRAEVPGLFFPHNKSVSGSRGNQTVFLFYIFHFEVTENLWDWSDFSFWAGWNQQNRDNRQEMVVFDINACIMHVFVSFCCVLEPVCVCGRCVCECFIPSLPWDSSVPAV